MSCVILELLLVAALLKGDFAFCYALSAEVVFS